MIVYKITNTVNGKGYIGITTRPLSTRLRQHKRDARAGGKFPLHRAMQKYGVSVFTTEELLKCNSIDELNAAECGQIAIHGTHTPNGYNVTIGGRGTMGRRASAREREAKSAQLKRIHANDPTIRARISASLREGYKTRQPYMLGKRHTDATISVLREKALARYATPGERERASAISLACQRPRTEKQQANAIRMATDPDIVARRRASFTATTSDSAKRAVWVQKIRVAQLATWQRRRESSPNGKAPQMGDHSHARRDTSGRFATLNPGEPEKGE